MSLTNITKQLVFWTIHLGSLVALWTGVSWIAATTCVLLYFTRMFAITGGFHRYFAHRTYKTSRLFQFLMALTATASAQKGPLWWSSHHRHHHRYSDTTEDVHSPRYEGFWWAHVGWVLSTQFIEPRLHLVKDFASFKELEWLDKYHMLPPLFLATAMYLFGSWLHFAHPTLGTSGAQMLVWGFCISTTLLYHGTFCVNSLTHLFGRQRFQTGDDSRNSLLIALVTLGEGWHNNHHRYPGSERQGFYWWEIDISHYILKFLSYFRIVWDLREPPERIYAEVQKMAASNR